MNIAALLGLLCVAPRSAFPAAALDDFQPHQGRILSQALSRGEREPESDLTGTGYFGEALARRSKSSRIVATIFSEASISTLFVPSQVS